MLDGMAGLWCVALGYSQERLAKAAYNQMVELPYYNTFFQTAQPPSIELAEKLASITPEGLNHVFYGSSGSESNDTIVRLVRHFWQVKGQPEKTVIIGRELGYHGSTLAGVSLGGQSGMHAQGGLPLPDFEPPLPLLLRITLDADAWSGRSSPLPTPLPFQVAFLQSFPLLPDPLCERPEFFRVAFQKESSESRPYRRLPVPDQKQ